jgi:hypothetical protein
VIVLSYTGTTIVSGDISMEEKILKSWSEFKSTIDEIRRIYGYHEYTIDTDHSMKFNNTILFRGQQNPNWRLETTLERKSQEIFTVRRYLFMATKSLNELESYTGAKWNVPDFPDVVEEINKKQSQFGPYLPYYDYLVYLRHHAYPSPLLDWTESPYIAAYFAMCDQPSIEQVSVYAYIETPSGLKSVAPGKATISLQGPYVSTDKRHFAQKAWYTVATRWSSENSEHTFCSHHDLFDNPENNQDILIKITIPAAERKLALRELSDYNINHFTLFQNEDALIKTLSMKDFDIGN